MHRDTDATVIPVPFARRRDGWLQSFGEAMRRHRARIQAIQWAVVVFYLVLVVYPAFLPLPPEQAHVYDNLTLFAQFVFWGIWWPFVMVSMMLMGRVWCGVFCPEGALTEFASRHGLGLAIPRWMRWGGWPFVAFAMTTLFGQLVSVYEYPKATLLVLGGSTVMAVGIGLVYGRGKRLWCRYLCPANGVFALLARLAPVHFRTDAQAWQRAPHHVPAVDCAPLVDVRHLSSASACHACGRCSGHRNAVRLQARSPNQEVLSLTPAQVSRWEIMTLVYGVLGIALGAFQWSGSPWFVAVKQAVAGWLVEHDSFWLLQDDAPWWLLTHYPEAHDVFTWLDGLLILVYIGSTALLLGSWILAWLFAAQRILKRDALMWRLAYSLIPLAGASVFLGLSMLTVTMLKSEGMGLAWVAPLRLVMLALALVWSGWLAVRLIRALPASAWRRLAAAACVVLAMLPVPLAWGLQFFVW
jgi:polyferredoxin